MVEKLDELVVDEGVIDEKLLTTVLAPFARIAKQTGKPVFTPAFSRLSEGDKILVYLLARKAGARLRILHEETATPKEISAETGVKYGTVKPTVSDLSEKGLVVSHQGSYSVPNHAVFQVEDRFARKNHADASAPR